MRVAIKNVNLPLLKALKEIVKLKSGRHQKNHMVTK